jgi:hypothetical protein
MASTGDPMAIAAEAARIAGHANFDLVVAAGYFAAYGTGEAAINGLKLCSENLSTAPDAEGRTRQLRFVFAERIPLAGILPALAQGSLESSIHADFADADSSFFSSDKAPGLSAESLVPLVAEAGLSPGKTSIFRHDSRRSLGDREAEAWLSEESAYGAVIRGALGPVRTSAVLAALKKAFADSTVSWPGAWAILLAS